MLPKRPKKEKPVNKLIEQLDDLHSEWVRRSNANNKGIVKCYTCPKEDHWKKMQCGHFQSRKHKNTRWHLLNTKPQCVGCNIFKQGEQYVFGKNLDLEYGEGTAESVEAMSRQTCKLTRADLVVMIEGYKQKLKEYAN
jgi:hypothetical protein